MKQVKTGMILIGVLLLSTMACSWAWAHDLWLTMDTYSLDKGAKASLAIFSSHKFPADPADHLAGDRLDQAFLVTPAGKQIAATANAEGTCSAQAPLSETGTYLAVALPHNGFSTKTTQGYQRGKNKKDLPNAIECRDSHKFAKSIFSVGTSGGEIFARPLGHAMEIVPLKDPADLKTGEVLPIKVLADGKPARTYVYGTYAGFSNEPNTFAYTTRTDKEGVASIKMLHNGIWVLIAKLEEAYPDQAECDKRTRAASLTFEIH